jgi:hypothetical protein
MVHNLLRGSKVELTGSTGKFEWVWIAQDIIEIIKPDIISQKNGFYLSVNNTKYEKLNPLDQILI